MIQTIFSTKLAELQGLCDELSLQWEVRGGGGVLPIMAYTGKLRPKGVPFSGFRYIKG